MSKASYYKKGNTVSPIFLEAHGPLDLFFTFPLLTQTRVWRNISLLQEKDAISLMINGLTYLGSVLARIQSVVASRPPGEPMCGPNVTVISQLRPIDAVWNRNSGMWDISVFWKECSLLISKYRKNFKNSIYRPNTSVNQIFPDLQPICSLFLKHKFDQVNHLFRKHDGAPSPMEYSPRSLDLPWGKNAHVLTSTSPLLICQKSLSSLEIYALAMAK